MRLVGSVPAGKRRVLRVRVRVGGASERLVQGQQRLNVLVRNAAPVSLNLYRAWEGPYFLTVAVQCGLEPEMSSTVEKSTQPCPVLSFASMVLCGQTWTTSALVTPKKIAREKNSSGSENSGNNGDNVAEAEAILEIHLVSNVVRSFDSVPFEITVSLSTPSFGISSVGSFFSSSSVPSVQLLLLDDSEIAGPHIKAEANANVNSNADANANANTDANTVLLPRYPRSQDLLEVSEDSHKQHSFDQPDSFQSSNYQRFQSKIHLIVLTHGLHGSVADMDYIAERFSCLHSAHTEERLSSSSNTNSGHVHGRIVVLPIESNHAKTEDGVFEGGVRVAEEVMKLVGPILSDSKTNHESEMKNVSNRIQSSCNEGEQRANVEGSHNEVTHNEHEQLEQNEGSSTYAISISISFIGHSLGGLYNRAAVGILLQRYPYFFELLKPRNFVTIATPHLGSFEQHYPVLTALQFGVVGATGLDLSMTPRITGPIRNEASSSSLSSSSALSPSSPSSSSSSSSSSSPSSSLSPSSSSEKVSCSKSHASCPFLLTLVKESEPYIHALRLFQHHTAYANVSGDLSVGYRTSSILHPLEILNGSRISTDPNQTQSLSHQHRHHNEIYTAEIDPIIPDSRSIISSTLIRLESTPQTVHDKTSIMTWPADFALGLSPSVTEMAVQLHRGITWRKVLLRFSGWFDAHVTCIVRRRWSNEQEGAAVVEHMMKCLDWEP